jgi:glycosyltransferase involved in cell wall biosynthesis
MRRAGTYGSFALSAATLGSALSGATDVIFANQPMTTGLPAALWTRLRSAPVVYHVPDIMPDTITASGMIRSDRVRWMMDRVLSRWCEHVYRHAAAITVLSPGFKQLLVERGVPADRIEVVYSWADEEIFHPGPRDEGLADSLGLRGKFTVLYPGNLGSLQGLDSAIRAAGRLKHLDDFQLMLVGTGRAEAELRSLVSRESITNVIFVGQRPYREMGAICNLADVLLVSLRDLGFFSATIPSKTQVALATGRPVLMAVRGDAAELIERSRAGITCRPGDVEMMAEVMETLFNSGASELAAMGIRGREFYRSELSMQRGAGNTESVLERAVTQDGTRLAMSS